MPYKTFDQNKWAARFIDMAKLVASWSKDPSTKAGAVIADGNRVISTGYNGFPVFCDDSEEIYFDKDRKYKRVVHAELNAILFAKGRSECCNMYCTNIPCSQCTAAIIQSGIKCVVVPEQDSSFMDRWMSSIRESIEMMEDAGVKCIIFKDNGFITIGDYIKIYK